jgi:hypothetical protein
MVWNDREESAMETPNNESAKINKWGIDPSKTELTPAELTAVYAKLKAEFVPPSEEEMKRLVEESIYTIDDLEEFLAKVEQETPMERA